MKKLIVLTVLMLIVSLVHCQSTYPKRAVVDNDTVNIFTDSQTKRMLQICIEKEYLEMMFVESQNMNFYNDSIILIQDSIINNRNYVIGNLNTIVDNQEKSIKGYKKRIIIERIKYLGFGIAVGVIIGLLL